MSEERTDLVNKIKHTVQHINQQALPASESSREYTLTTSRIVWANRIWEEVKDNDRLSVAELQWYLDKVQEVDKFLEQSVKKTRMFHRTRESRKFP